jgi:DNA-binding response OmpR family regulator
MPLVLIVEDDAIIARTISAHLRQAGMDVEWAADGELGLRRLRFGRPDACVIDLMLPTLDGWSLTARARAEGLEMPILIVSARASEADKVRALEIGADDYLAKPFGMAELVARVQAALRRSVAARPTLRPEPVRVPGLLIDPDQQRALLVDETTGAERDPRLTPTEFRLLWTLAENQGRVMTRDALLQRVWGVPYRPRDRSVDVCVKKLREKLTGAPYAYVHTHYGIGYRFAAEQVDEQAEAAADEALAGADAESTQAEPAHTEHAAAS